VAGAVFGAEQRCVPTERSTTRRYLKLKIKIEKKIEKKTGEQSYPQSVVTLLSRSLGIIKG